MGNFPGDFYLPLDADRAATIDRGSDPCPKCKSKRTQVVDSRVGDWKKDWHRRRRRACADCGWRWTTIEVSAEQLNALEAAAQSAAAIDRAIFVLKQVRNQLTGKSEEET